MQSGLFCYYPVYWLASTITYFTMKLYERDYTTLTNEEEEIWRIVREKQVVVCDEKLFIGDQEVFISVGGNREYPKAARHFMSIFPNNFLDPVELEGKEHLSKQLQEFKDIP